MQILTTHYDLLCALLRNERPRQTLTYLKYRVPDRLNAHLRDEADAAEPEEAAISQAGLTQATVSPIAASIAPILLEPAKPASELAQAEPARLIPNPNAQQFAQPGDIQLTCLL